MESIGFPENSIVTETTKISPISFRTARSESNDERNLVLALVCFHAATLWLVSGIKGRHLFFLSHFLRWWIFFPIPCISIFICFEFFWPTKEHRPFLKYFQYSRSRVPHPVSFDFKIQICTIRVRCLCSERTLAFGVQKFGKNRTEIQG